MAYDIRYIIHYNVKYDVLCMIYDIGYVKNVIIWGMTQNLCYMLYDIRYMQYMIYFTIYNR